MPRAKLGHSPVVDDAALSRDAALLSAGKRH